MDLSAVVSRLQDRVTGLREIGSAAGLVAARRSNLAAPAAYAIPLGESATQTGLLGVTEQRVTSLFAVLQVVDVLDTSGANAVLDLVGMRRQVKAALMGWVPDALTGEAVLFMGGALVQFEDDGHLWWSDEFQLMSYERSA